jgi:hypothetical protein
MNIESKEKFKGILSVPVGLAIILVPFSLLIGWNLVTLILFWFVLIPAGAIYFPALVSKNKNHLVESLFGLTIFYAIMVFMIYDHYKTDYFQIMIWSCALNLLFISAMTWPKSRTHKDAQTY